MGMRRAALVQQALDHQMQLYRYLRPAREWLEADLTMPQLKVLFFLYSEGGVSMSHLAGALGVALSTVTGIIDRLVDHRLVQREEPPQDRRVVVCRLTERGNGTVERLHQSGRTRLSQLLDTLSLDELGTVTAGLEVLTTAARRHAEAPERAEPGSPCVSGKGVNVSHLPAAVVVGK